MDQIIFILQMRQEVYFLSSQKTRPSLFGLPLVVLCSASSTHQVSRGILFDIILVFALKVRVLYTCEGNIYVDFKKERMSS